MNTLLRIFTLLLLAGMLFAGCSETEPEPPNVILILADDLGFSDLGCYGGEILTPNLDGLAENGLRFTQFYNCGRCWPTRGSLMTGYYPQMIGRDNAPGIKGGGRGKRPDWAGLLPEYLKAAGYRSYHSGKWHIDGMPIESGFDHSYYLADQARFFSPTTHYEDDVQLPGVERGTGYYGTTEIADRAIAHLKQHKVDHPDAPFFSYIAMTPPHFPLHALQEDIDKIGERYAAGWEELRQKRWNKIQEMGIVEGELSAVEPEVGPPYHFPDAMEILGSGEVNRPVPWESLSPEQKKFQEVKMAIHAAMIERMDIEIGRIIDQVRNMDALDNTLIMFLSDNGASAEIMVRDDGHDPEADPGSASTHLCLGPGWSNMCNTPFRRHKTWVHEGGTCTPFVAHWPDGIASRGELRHTQGHVIDVVPTILELAGVPSGAHDTVPLPGKSLRQLFEGDTDREHNLWWYHEGNQAVRSGNWKLVAASEEDWELFDLSIDRTESNNLMDKYPGKADELEGLWNDMLQEIREVSPGKIEGKEEVSVTTENLE